MDVRGLTRAAPLRGLGAALALGIGVGLLAGGRKRRKPPKARGTALAGASLLAPILSEAARTAMARLAERALEFQRTTAPET